MISKTEVSKALDGAFRAALMLTGSMQAAEHAVFNGIAATECYSAEDDALLLETVKAAIQRRPDSLHESQEPPAQFQRVFPAELPQLSKTMSPFFVFCERIQSKCDSARTEAFNHSAADVRTARHKIREASLNHEVVSILYPPGVGN